MKLKGELDSIGVTELFKTLAEQRATGILAVISPMGEKTIALAHGEIAICADNLTERTRLGDLLIARGRLTDEQLSSALKAQRFDPRSKLGDVLVKQGIVTNEIINEALRFQVEEQIIDLFTWKEASFEFDSERLADDIFDPEGSGAAVHRLNINTQPLLAEAAKRTENWKQIQERIPTPYLCFKITPKGEELASKAPRNTQVVIKFLKEGRTLETTIKKSCLGRFNVCNTVIKLLDDAWVFPIPVNELRYLASEHRFKKRFFDALYLYRRLLDTTQVPSERGELEKQIRDTMDAILAAAASGEKPEGAEIVSYKDAAARFKRKRKVRRIALGVLGVAALGVSVYFMLREFAPKAALSDDYQKAIKSADALVSEMKYEDAIKLWDNFYKSIPDKSSDTANSVRERESTIIKKLKSHIDALLMQGNTAEQAKKYDDANGFYTTILRDFPKSDVVAQAQEGLDRIKNAQNAAQVAAAAAAQKQRVDAALALLEQKQYAAARKSLQAVLEELPAGADQRIAIEGGLKRIQEMEDRARTAFNNAHVELQNKRGEKAIDFFDQVSKEWPEVSYAEDARNERQRLQLRLDKVKEELARGKKAEDEGGVVTAQEILRQAEKEYAEFEITAQIRAQIEVLNGKVDELNAELEKAEAAMKADKTRGRALFGELIRREFAFLAVKNVKIPVPISSTPAGALVKLDGKEVGKTPLDVLLPVSGASTLRLEMAGYEDVEQHFNRLMPDELAPRHITFKLKADNVINLDGAIFAPPRIIDGSLFVFHGTSLEIIDPTGKASPRRVEKLFDDEQNTRPDPFGGGSVLVTSKTWWCPRAAPEAFKPGKVLLILRNGEIKILDVASLSVETLVTVPMEPIGRPYLEPASLLAQKPLLAVGCSDGKIYIFDMQANAQLEKVSPVQADPRPGRRTSLATGLVSYAANTFVSLTTSGYMRCVKIHDGTEVWNLDLNGEVAGDNVMPEGNDSLGAFVMKDGRVVGIDVRQHEKVWEIPALPTEEASHAVVAADGIYVMTRRGILRKFDRTAIGGKLNSVWSHPLDGDSRIPMLADKSVFVCTDVGTIWNISTNNDKLWEYRTNEEPSRMTLFGGLLFITTPTGKVLVLKAKQ